MSFDRVKNRKNRDNLDALKLFLRMKAKLNPNLLIVSIIYANKYNLYKKNYVVLNKKSRRLLDSI